MNKQQERRLSIISEISADLLEKATLLRYRWLTEPPRPAKIRSRKPLIAILASAASIVLVSVVILAVVILGPSGDVLTGVTSVTFLEARGNTDVYTITFADQATALFYVTHELGDSAALREGIVTLSMENPPPSAFGEYG